MTASRSVLPVAADGHRRETGVVRTARTTAAAVTAITAVGVSALAAGRFASAAALKVRPGGPLPTEPRLTVHAAAADRIILTRDLASLRPGVHGLVGDGSHATVGPVEEAAPHSADTVVRRLEHITRGPLRPGMRVRFTPQAYTGDPMSALGIDHADVDISGELGPLPAWFVPGARDTWVITAHGLGTTREHPMVIMEFLRRHHFPVLDLAYRGDPGAPPVPEGLSHLGASEWRDMDAAIRHAVRNGAARVILHGWSTGATMALYTAAFSALRDRVVGIVLDSPVLDWATTVRALARARHTPGLVLPLAVRAALGRTGLDGDLVHQAARQTLALPTLVVHGPDDAIASFALSRGFADRPGALASLHTVLGAPHGAMWNADPTGYEEVLRRFLVPLM